LGIPEPLFAQGLRVDEEFTAGVHFYSAGGGKLLPVPKAFEKLITMYGFHNKSSTQRQQQQKQHSHQHPGERTAAGRMS